MKVAIVGAGAIGGLLGAHLARSGQDVVLIARGPHLAAMQQRGLTVRSADGEFTVNPRCTDEIAAIGGTDVVFITLKAHSIPAVAPKIGASLSDTTPVVGAVNGVPWWYFADRHLETVDPGGVIASNIPLKHVVGCVVYPAASVVEPGVIFHVEGNRFSVGEPDGSKSERVQSIAALLTAAGFKAPVQSRLRNEIWLKLVGNAVLNPVSAVTGATLGEMFQSSGGRQLVRALMDEVASVASALGIELPVSVERRMAGAAAVGDHKTSMLQDVEAHRPLELDAVLGAVIELAGDHGVSVPALRALYGLAQLRDVSSRRNN